MASTTAAPPGRRSGGALDKEAIEKDTALTLSECDVARKGVDLEAQSVLLAESLGETTTASMPRFTRYSVRVRESWAAIGERSGFLHNQRWSVDAESGQGLCLSGADEPTLQARIVERSDATSYGACPPSSEALSHDAPTPLYTSLEEGRFTNPSFSLDIFEGCAQVGDDIQALASQRGMQWSFEVEGPDSPKVTAAHRINSFAGTVLHTPKVPVMHVQRQQVQLDSGGRRVHILQTRANALDHIATFE